LNTDDLDKTIKEISKYEVISPSQLTELLINFGDEVIRAVELLNSNRAFRIKMGKYMVDAFSGDSGDYIIFDQVGYCGCMSRHPINITRRRYCPHIIAFKILKALDKIEELEFSEDDFDWVMRYLKFNIEEAWPT